MTRLRIVCAMPFYFPSTIAGGAGSQAYAIHQALAERGHQVRVVTTDVGIAATTPRDSWIVVGNHHVWYAATKPWHRVAPYYTPSIKTPLERTLADADVLQMRVGLSLTLAMARPIALRSGVPYVYNSEGALGRYNLLSKWWQKKLFLRFFERRILKDARALQAFTQQGRVDLIAQGAPADRIAVIPNGVPLEALGTNPGGGEFRQKVGLTDQPLVLFMGRIASLKGTELLLRAFVDVAAAVPRAVLCFAGPDEGMVEKLRRLSARFQVADRVYFPGNLSGALRTSCYQAARTLVLPSYAEGLPMSVLEAAALGIPVVVSERCNLPEVVDFESGLVCDLDPNSIARGIKTMLLDDEKHARFAMGAMRMIRERFELSHVVEQLESLYLSIAGSDKQRHT